MNVWGEKLKLTIFGESHGAGIGVVIDGLPSGFEVDMDEIAEDMERRAPGRNRLSTSRQERDDVQIMSGLFNGKTTGTPLAAVIFNTDTRSGDYNPNLLRPSHADFTAICKYGQSRDYRGGGHFSGRITAPLVFAGAVAKQILAKKGIYTGAHIMQIGSVTDKPFDMVNTGSELLQMLSRSEFPVICSDSAEKMKNEIDKYRCDKNSVGGKVEVCISGVEAGIGNPFFGSVESRIASMMFSIPAIKGIEFGMGFDFASADGQNANDEFYIEDDKIKTYTNNNGGINGGIANGMPIVFRLAVKPTPSVSATQRTVNIETKENTEIEIKGRHDPCIVHRAAIVAECATAVAVLDMLLDK